MNEFLDRWQFGVTTVYHFLFVPLTIGLGLLVAVMQTLAYRRHDLEWEKLSRFFGRLFLINFAMGVATGIVQEFQFGMNWSTYSVFVGNIFGAPLAIEGLLAFFMESTFLGLWIFGRDRLSPRLHLATIWLTSVGTMLSALFILGANAWMQHPVGYKIVDNRAVLTDFWAVMGNSTLWEEYAHTVLAAFVTGGMFLLGVSAWRLVRHKEERFRRAVKLGAGFSLACLILVMGSGDTQARLMDEQQPMKMAAAEALYHTSAGASFSLLTVGDLSDQPIFQVRVPHLLSLIADMSWDGKVKGIDQVQAEEAAKYGKGSYIPVIWVTYWSFRLMIGFGVLILLVSLWGLLLARRGPPWRGTRWVSRPGVAWLGLIGIALPFLANTAGWIFTEMGRQPWIVYGLMRTSQAASPNVGTASVALTFGGFVAVYTILGFIDLVLMRRYAHHDLDDTSHDPTADEGQTPALIY